MEKIISVQGIQAIKLREYEDGIYTSAGFVQEYEEVGDDYKGPLWINSCAALHLPLDWMNHLVNKIDIADNKISLSDDQYTITDIDWNQAQQYENDERPSGSLKPVFTLSDGSKVNKVWFTQELIK